MQNFLALGAVLALILGAAACQPAGSAADLQEIKRVQAEILEKLVALEKKLPATQARAQRPDDEFDRVYEIEVGEAPVRGNPNAEVTIVEYSDFQCPFCARAQPILEAVLEKYPDDVRLVYKHFPLSFHKAARPTAIASLAAMEQGLFWEMHDVLFEAGSDLDAAKIQHYAEKAGLNIERFNRDMETKKAAYDSLITTDYRAGSEVDVRGTPTLFVNGKKVRVRTVEGMSAMIDAALAAKAG